MASVVTPESTRRVLQPPFCPNKISVSNLSPTIHICDFEMPNLWFNEITTELREILDQNILLISFTILLFTVLNKKVILKIKRCICDIKCNTF